MVNAGVKLLRLQHTDADSYDGELLCSTITADKFFIDTSSSANLTPTNNYQLASKYYVDLISSSGGASGGAYWSRDTINSIIYPTIPFDNLQVHNLQAVGTVSANSLFFTSTTAIALSVTSKALNFYGALSITGDTIPPVTNYLFRVAKQDNTAIFLVSTGGNIGIGQDVGATWNPVNKLSVIGNTHLSGNLSATELFKVNDNFLVTTAGRVGIGASVGFGWQPSEYLDIFQGNQLITDGTFKMKQVTDTLLYFNGLENTYRFYDYFDTPVVSITPSLTDKLSVTGNTYIIGDLNVDGAKNFKINHPNPNKKDKFYLIHSALEGPELGVYWRTSIKFKKSKNKIFINFPDYWEFLIEENSTQIYLSSIGSKLKTFVKKIKPNGFLLKRKKFKNEIINCLVFGIRKSDKKFQIEISKD